MKTGNIIITTLVCLLVIPLFHAVQAEGDVPEAGNQAPYSKGLLWRIEKDDNEIGHIFGTIHLNDSRITRIPENLRRILDESESFSMENFPGDILDPTIGMPRFKEVMLFTEEGQNLKTVIGDELYKRVSELLMTVGFTEEKILPLKPWMAMHSISIELESKGEILDRKLLEIADRQHKHMFRIESPGEMVSSFYSMPMEAQTSLLEDVVNNYPNLNKMLEQMLTAYLDEDLQAIIDISTSFIPDNPKKLRYKETYLKHALYNRNVVMQHYMRAPLREGGAFIAIGALHLYGEKGVLALLEKDGYTLTRVPL